MASSSSVVNLLAPEPEWAVSNSLMGSASARAHDFSALRPRSCSGSVRNQDDDTTTGFGSWHGLTCGRVSSEPICVYLQDSWALVTHMIDYCFACGHGVGHVLTVHEQSGDPVVEALLVDVRVGCDVGSEGVDGTTVVDHDEQDGQVLLGRCVQTLCHSAVLCSTVTCKREQQC
jgi:hypothetical protein